MTATHVWLYPLGCPLDGPPWGVQSPARGTCRCTKLVGRRETAPSPEESADNVVRESITGKFRCGSQPEFVHHAVFVELNGLGRDPKGLGHFFGGLSFRNQL